jgi:carbon-monoxide dehydrogenase small subunit
MEISFSLDVNGKKYAVEVEPGTTLLEALRDLLKVKSVHRGCEEGECGACTVLLDGKPVNSCLVLAVQAEGSKIMTVEGLMKGDELHPIMISFLENHGLQCGYCTSGMLMTAYYLINTHKNLSEEDIRKGIAGNLCRCTGYVNIIKSIKVAKAKKDAGEWW